MVEKMVKFDDKKEFIINWLWIFDNFLKYETFW
jgi:hypothetical protein